MTGDATESTSPCRFIDTTTSSLENGHLPAGPGLGVALPLHLARFAEPVAAAIAPPLLNRASIMSARASANLNWFGSSATPDTVESDD